MEAQRDALLASQAEAPQSPPAILQRLRGIGPEFAMVLWSEGLFRHFANRRQLASYAGLAPTPWQSGMDLLHKSGEHLLKQEVFYGARNQVYDGVQARGGAPGAKQWPEPQDKA